MQRTSVLARREGTLTTYGDDDKARDLLAISPNVLRRWIVPECETLGLNRVSWLTLRRTYSSWAHEKGVPGKVIAQLLGHAKIDTTLNVYAQVVDGSLRRAADHGRIRIVHVHKPEAAAGPA